MKADRLLRVVDVLELLSHQSDGEGLRLSSVSQSLDLPLSSTHNLLKGLAEARLVTADADRGYRVGPRAVRLAVALLAGITVREVGRPYFRDLAAEIGHDVYLAMRMGDEVVYVDRFLGAHHVGIDIRMGQRLHLHATAVGKLFAAFHADLRAQVLSEQLPAITPHTITDRSELNQQLDLVCERGYALTDGEAVLGIRGLAVPVKDPDNTLVAAIHVSILAAAHDDAQSLLDVARRAAIGVEAEIGGQTPPTKGTDARDRPPRSFARVRNSDVNEKDSR